MATLDEATLRRMYLEEQRSIRTIAETLGYSHRTIYDALMRWRIPRRQRGMPKSYAPLTLPIDEATLRQFYLEQGHTIKEIALKLNVSSSLVWYAMNCWKIPRRRRGPRL